MKIRKDFVTNSSSSSYIIAYKANVEFDSETLSKYPFLKTYNKMLETIVLATGGEDTSTGDIFENKAQWDEHFIEYYSYEYDTVDEILERNASLRDIYEKAIKYLDNGFHLLYKSIDYNDDSFLNIINNISKNSDAIVILDELA